MKNKIVAFMPIRINSQRINEKVIMDILGRPMFCHSLEKLDSLGIPVYVYSNCEEILRNSLDFDPENVIFLRRPENLDSHETKGIEIYKSFAKEVKSEIYLLAHCTSPFIKRGRYQEAIDAVVGGEYNSSFTAEKKQTFAWFEGEMLNFALPRPKTQELSPVFFETSAAYCFRKEVLEDNSRTGQKSKPIITSSLESIDIDNVEDLEILKLNGYRNVIF